MPSCGSGSESGAGASAWPASCAPRAWSGSVTGENVAVSGPRPHRTRTWCAATSPPPVRTGCGAPTPAVHPTSDGRVYCCAVLDVFTRQVVGWSIADHMRSELVVDALEMARWRRRPAPGTIVHADRGSQYTSWIFGHRLRAAGLLGSMGRVASSVDNSMIESFWSSMQRELLDRRQWATRPELASAIFEWIEGFYNPVRRHSALGYRSPIEFENLHTAAELAA
jgi:putative transposase